MIALFVLICVGHRLMALFHGMSPVAELVRSAVAKCPMLALLYIGIHMRAVEVAGPQGFPPYWILRLMDSSLAVVVAEVVSAMLLLLVRSDARQTEPGGVLTPRWKPSPGDSYWMTRNIILYVRLNLSIFLYCLTAGIVFGFFRMTRDACLAHLD